MNYQIRDFCAGDADAVNAVALAAFAEFQSAYTDWSILTGRIRNMSSLAESGELIVAVAAGEIIGAVVYVGPGGPKPEFFNLDWPVIRMLVVEPAARGYGVGRRLTEECIRRAERDGAPVIALHTSTLMKTALPMYLRMGFEFKREAPSLLGVEYGIYVKRLVYGGTESNLDKTALSL